jgi:hypothetical protein
MEKNLNTMKRTRAHVNTLQTILEYVALLLLSAALGLGLAWAF